MCAHSSISIAMLITKAWGEELGKVEEKGVSTQCDVLGSKNAQLPLSSKVSNSSIPAFGNWILADPLAMNVSAVWGDGRGLLWCNHWFHRDLSRRDAHPVPCELHSFAEYGITLAWIHACRGSSHGESIWLFPKTKCWLEEVGSPFWKALKRVGIFIPWVNSDPSKHQIYVKSKGVQTLHFWAQTCSCHMPLPIGLWSIFRDLPLKRTL